VAEECVQRRLAAILAADVAGYSRLMGGDEEGTLAALTAHRTELRVGPRRFAPENRDDGPCAKLAAQTVRNHLDKAHGTALAEN
jgi:hypothetical protein